MRPATRVDRRVLLAAAAVVVTLAAGSTVAIAAASGAFDRHTAYGPAYRAATCTAPSLPGSVVDAALIDVGGMGGRGGMGGMMGGRQGGWRSWHAGMMRLASTPQSVPHGTVSLRVTNRGVITHELVVLPLTNGQSVGSRTIGADGRVAETGSLGEVSTPCAAGAGEGLTPGSTGWTTLTLPAGRYELICNLARHYGTGMYSELDVT
jgi:uncharacterized cupredoxin-like copper-binding protein